MDQLIPTLAALVAPFRDRFRSEVFGWSEKFLMEVINALVC